jgi:hypothetical protein
MCSYTNKNPKYSTSVFSVYILVNNRRDKVKAEAGGGGG